MKFFFHDFEIFVAKEKCQNISGHKMCVMKNYLLCSITIKFHSYYHDNVSFKRELTIFIFLVIDITVLQSCLKLFIRDRKNTDLAGNLVMAAPVTINSTLDNTWFLDPLLKYIFKS